MLRESKRYCKKNLFIFTKVLRKINSYAYRVASNNRYTINSKLSSCLKKVYHQLDRWVDRTRDAYYREEAQYMVGEKLCANRKKQLFFDVTTLSLTDDKTGIQRVVRSILQEWIKLPPNEFDVQPVQAHCGRYRYAHEFFEKFLNNSVEQVKKGYIDYQAGDIFLSADLNHEAVFACETFYQKMRHQGVKVFFVVHDLLCMTMPEYFFDFAAEKHERWLRIIVQNDGVVCVSKTVADEVSAWIVKHAPQYKDSLRVTWFHLGADLKNSVPTMGMPGNAYEILNNIKSRPSFLMVGRLEPRKGHEQVLKAFELLWRKNIKINLVIVGKQGWRVDAWANTLRTHTSKQQSLYWIENATDEFLENIYSACDCLIAASEGEGFGLPLIEAASYGLPLIVRNIPIFHEVTQEHAYFFDGKSPEAITQAIILWLKLFATHQHPSSKEITYLTWQQSAQQLLSIILKQETGKYYDK